jgi:ATP-dependent protease ClpP protease subunit
MNTKKHTASKSSFDISELLPMKSDGKPAYTERNQGRILDFYILGEIEHPEEYADWFDTIRNCGLNDIVRIHFNSQGGDLFTAIQFMRVLRECQGMTIASAEGACMSAATLIFLSCDSFEVSAHTSFMIHNYSGGTFGKGGEMMDQLTFESKWAETLFNDAYTGFLTPSEITSVLKGQDMWMSADQVIERLNARQELKKAAEEAAKAEKPVETHASR